MCCLSLLSVTEALHFQQKLDETTKLLHDLQEAQKERLSAKQPPNMICLLAPTAKELELGKSLSVHGPLCSSTLAVSTSCRPQTLLHLPLYQPPYTDVVCVVASQLNGDMIQIQINTDLILRDVLFKEAITETDFFLSFSVL